MSASTELVACVCARASISSTITKSAHARLVFVWPARRASVRLMTVMGGVSRQLGGAKRQVTSERRENRQTRWRRPAIEIRASHWTAPNGRQLPPLCWTRSCTTGTSRLRDEIGASSMSMPAQVRVARLDHLGQTTTTRRRHFAHCNLLSFKPCGRHAWLPAAIGEANEGRPILVLQESGSLAFGSQLA